MLSADASGRSRRIGHVDMDAFFASVEQRDGDTLREQAERVARELRSQGVTAACVTLELRFADFRTLTRRRSGEPTQDGLELHRRASALLGRERLVLAVRLLGGRPPACRRTGRSSSRCSTPGPSGGRGWRTSSTGSWTGSDPAPWGRRACWPAGNGGTADPVDGERAAWLRGIIAHRSERQGSPDEKERQAWSSER